MLSRIADSLFWIARYMERAEDTARLLDVTYYMLLEGPARGWRLRWGPLVAIAGDEAAFAARYPEATAQSVHRFLGFDVENPSSIVQCIAKARENARTIRDRLSREMWEDLNGLFLTTSGVGVEAALAAGPHEFCSLVKFGCQRFQGVADATLPRDEGWHFLRAGQALERTGMTARIVDVQYHSLVEGASGAGEPDNHQCMAVLKSVAAYEFYRRRYHSRIEPAKVVELLVLNPIHPRSIRFSVATLESSLRAISGAPADRYTNEAERLAGRLHDALKYDRIEDVLARGLHAYLADVQRLCCAIGDAIAASYFHYAVAS